MLNASKNNTKYSLIQPKIVIIGCGFGGLEAAKALRKADVDITVIDRQNHHLFQPLLYQVATAGLTAPAIAEPIRRIFRTQRNVKVLMAEVTGLDAIGSKVTLSDGQALPYDHLIVAAGATHSYFGHDNWATHAPGLKTLDDAFVIRRKMLLAYERVRHCLRMRVPPRDSGCSLLWSSVAAPLAWSWRAR